MGFAYEISIPGSGTFKIESPVELTDAQAYHAASQQAEVDPTKGMGVADKFSAGAGRAVNQLLLGGRQLLSKVPGINTFDTFNPQNVDAAVADARQTDAPLMATTAGKTGDFVGSLAALVPSMLVPGSQTVYGAGLLGAATGALQPVLGDESRGLNMAVGGALGAGSQYLGNKVANSVATRLANRGNELAVEQGANAARDATLEAAQKAGYVIPPTNVQAGPINSILEGIGGKVKTAQAASFANQEATNNLARNALGLAPDVPLTRETLAAVRESAGANGYAPVANLQSVNWDHAFEKGIASLVPSGSGAVKNPALPQIQELADAMLNKAAWTGRELVDDVKLLREMGNNNLGAASRAGGDTAKSMLGKAQLKASALLEDLAERNLANNKAPADAIQALKDARQLIAKSYTVERALDSGNVSASTLAAALKKGKPLSGELELIAKTAQEFPKATQTANKIGSQNPVSALDAISGAAMGGITSAVTGNPLGMLAAAAPLTRPLARSVVLSGPYQRAMVQAQTYNPSLLLRGADAALWSPLGRALPAPIGITSGLLATQQ